MRPLDPDRDRVTLLGLQQTGHPLAVAVSRQFRTVVYDQDSSRAASLSKELAQGGKSSLTAASIGEAVRGSNVVLTCFTDIHEVAVAFSELVHTFDSAESAQKALAGLVWIDFSPGEPGLSFRLAQDMDDQFLVQLVECASIGGGRSALHGSRIVVGCEEEVMERAEPLLRCLGKDPTYVGGCGAAKALRAVHSSLKMTQLTASLEMLAVVRKLGIDPARAVSAFEGMGLSGGDMLPRVLEDEVLSRRFQSGESFQDLGYDMDTIGLLCDARDVSAPVSRAAREAVRGAKHRIGAQADLLELARDIEAGSSTTIVAGEHADEEDEQEEER